MMALRRYLTPKYDWTGLSSLLYHSEMMELISIIALASITGLFIYFLHGPIVLSRTELETFAPLRVVESGYLVIFAILGLVMCSGRIDLQLILEAFRDGADGVLVTDCHPGDCHHIEGNLKTLRRMALLRRIVESLGIEKERLRLEWISAAEAAKFVKVPHKMVEQIKALGPLRPSVQVRV
jgi:coenzyme F420-reducing hydrogenase delta subunit